MLELMSQKVDLYKKPKNSIEYLFKIGDYEAIINQLDKINDEKEYFQYIGALFGLGELSIITAFLNKADIYIKKGNNYLFLYVQFFKARIAFYRGDYNLGFELLEKIILEISKIPLDSLELSHVSIIDPERFKAMIYCLKGENLVSQNKAQEGIKFLNLSKDLYEQNQFTQYPEPWIRHQLGRAYLMLGKLDQAKIEIERSLELREKIGNHHHIAMSMNLLGILYEQLGDLEEANMYFHRAIHVATLKQSHPFIVSALQNNLGLVLIKQGNLVEARKYLLDALDTGKALDEKKLFTPLIKDEIIRNLQFIDKTLQEIRKKLEIKSVCILLSNKNLVNPREIQKYQQLEKIKSILQTFNFGVYQKDIPKLTHLSKATISRRINELIESNIVESRIEGNTRLLYLKT